MKLEEVRIILLIPSSFRYPLVYPLFVSHVRRNGNKK